LRLTQKLPAAFGGALAELPATQRLCALAINSRTSPCARSYGRRSLAARRLVEAGGRFVQVFTLIKPFIQP
jgi:hypothetical protein